MCGEMAGRPGMTMFLDPTEAATSAPTGSKIQLIELK
jgi:hypothetical protein